MSHKRLKMINGEQGFLRLLGGQRKASSWRDGYITHCHKQLRWSTRPLWKQWKQERQSQNEYDRRTLIVVIAKSATVCLKFVHCCRCQTSLISNLTIYCPSEMSGFQRHLYHSPLGSPTSEDRQIFLILSAGQHRSLHPDLWRYTSQECSFQAKQ